MIHGSKGPKHYPPPINTHYINTKLDRRNSCKRLFPISLKNQKGSSTEINLICPGMYPQLEAYKSLTAYQRIKTAW